MNATAATTTFQTLRRAEGAEVLLNITTACRIIGVSTPTLKTWILKGELRGIPSPFAELDAPSTRKYTTASRLREWYGRVSEVKAA
jgi:predicted site-specific integrase-resolvase